MMECLVAVTRSRQNNSTSGLTHSLHSLFSLLFSLRVKHTLAKEIFKGVNSSTISTQLCVHTSLVHKQRARVEGSRPSHCPMPLPQWWCPPFESLSLSRLDTFILVSRFWILFFIPAILLRNYLSPGGYVLVPSFFWFDNFVAIVMGL